MATLAVIVNWLVELMSETLTSCWIVVGLYAKTAAKLSALTREEGEKGSTAIRIINAANNARTREVAENFSFMTAYYGRFGEVVTLLDSKGDSSYRRARLSGRSHSGKNRCGAGPIHNP